MEPLGLHPQCSIKTDDLAIHHRVLYQGLDEVCILIWISQARGKGDRVCQLLPHCGRQAGQERGVEEAWGGETLAQGGVGLDQTGLPGAMVHTRMLYLARSLAMGSVIPTMAPLLAE